MVDASRRREVPCSRWRRSTDGGTPSIEEGVADSRCRERVAWTVRSTTYLRSPPAEAAGGSSSDDDAGGGRGGDAFASSVMVRLLAYGALYTYERVYHILGLRDNQPRNK